MFSDWTTEALRQRAEMLADLITNRPTLSGCEELVESARDRIHLRVIAYCQEPGCRCDHRSGNVCRDQDEADFYASRGYLVREEIISNGPWHGLTPEEVLRDRAEYNRICGQ